MVFIANPFFILLDFVIWYIVLRNFASIFINYIGGQCVSDGFVCFKYQHNTDSQKMLRNIPFSLINWECLEKLLSVFLLSYW